MITLSKNEQIKSFLYLHSNIDDEDEAKEIINTLEGLRSDWDNLRNPLFERVFPLVFTTYGYACIILHNYDKAIDILNEGAKELEHKDFQYFFGEKVILYELLSKAYIHKADIQGAYEAALNKVYYELYAINNTHSNNFEFYGFRDFSEHSLADLTNETISLCSPDLFNDPVDTAFLPWMHYQQQIANNEEQKYLKVLQDAYMNIRARSFVRNIPLPYKEGFDYPNQLDFQREYANTVMWAHYANHHQGFCVKYTIPASFTISEPNKGRILMLLPINYTERFPLTGQVEKKIKFKDVFLTKQKLWEYEHEHRLLYFDKNGSPKFPTPTLPKGSIKAVYLGVKCSCENKNKLLNAIKDNFDIEIYQMQISSEDIYKLKAVKINRKDN